MLRASYCLPAYRYRNCRGLVVSGTVNRGRGIEAHEPTEINEAPTYLGLILFQGQGLLDINRKVAWPASAGL